MAIQDKQGKLQVQITKLSTAFKKDDYKDFVFHSNNIRALCDEIMPFLSDLTSEENSNLMTTISPLKSEAEALALVAKKGAAKHEEAHDHFTKMQVAVADLATQMKALKQ